MSKKFEFEFPPIPKKFIVQLKSEFIKERYGPMKEKLTQVIELLTALRDGKTLQFHSQQDGGWNDARIASTCLLWEYPERYRIKPEPREWTIIVFKADNKALFTFKNHSDAVYQYTNGYSTEEQNQRELIKVREVL